MLPKEDEELPASSARPTIDPGFVAMQQSQVQSDSSLADESEMEPRNAKKEDPRVETRDRQRALCGET